MCNKSLPDLNHVGGAHNEFNKYYTNVLGSILVFQSKNHL